MNYPEIKDRLRFNIKTNRFIVIFITLMVSSMLFILLWKLFVINVIICSIMVLVILYFILSNFIYDFKFYDNYFIINYPLTIRIFSRKKKIHFYNEIKYISYSWETSYPVTIPEIDIIIYKKILPILIICFSIEKITGLVDFLKGKQIEMHGKAI